MSKKEIIKSLCEAGVIYNKPVKLRSGQSSDFYCDIKKAFGYPDLLASLADEIGKLVTKEITCVAASGYGGLPLAIAVALRRNLKFIAVRDKVKRHGKGGFIDGYIPTQSDKILIIDDVLTTGSSIKETYSVLRKIKADVSCAVVVVKRGEAKLPIPYKYIFTIDEFK